MTRAPLAPAEAHVVEGQILAGKYRVERVIGSGGMGIVVAAVHLSLGQRVALKLLRFEPTRETLKRFVREVRLTARLRSEHVARVLDAGALEDGKPYLALEYLEGETLSSFLKKRQTLAVSEAVDAVLQASEAIAEAHGLGIVHRDLKPSNLFATTDASGTVRIKVLDFGISKLVEPAGSEVETAITRSDEMLGSPEYMAPEQWESAREVDARADIWAMGAILYKLTTGQRPFKAGSVPELFLMMLNGQRPSPPRSYRPDLPEPLESAILRCLQKDRDQRFASIGELAEAIGPYGSAKAAKSVAKIQRQLEQASRPGDNGPPSSHRSAAAFEWAPESASVDRLPPNVDPAGAETRVMRGGKGSTASAPWRQRLLPALLAVVAIVAVLALVALVARLER